MPKVMKFVEAYVQWLAVGLGLLWVLWVGYAYWLNPATKKEISGKMYGPGEVDEFVARDQGPVDKLAIGVKGEGRIPTDIVEYFSKIPRYVATLKSKMALEDYTPPVLAAMWPPSKGIQGPDVKSMEGVQVQATLPVLTPDTLVLTGLTNGLSVANVPDPDAVVIPGDLQQKVLLDATNPAAKPVVLSAKDVSWVTVLSKLDPKKMAAAFTLAGIPEAAANTEFLRVQLIRQELLPGGSWDDDETVVTDLANQTKLPWPPKAGGTDEGLYLDWASKSVADIIQPAFYEVVRGDLWRTTSMPEIGADPNAVAGQPVAFDPALVKDTSKLTPEERKIWVEWRTQKTKEDEDKRKADAEARKAKQTPRTPTGGGRNTPPSSAPPMPADQPIGPQRRGREPVGPVAPPRRNEGSDRGDRRNTGPTTFNPNPAGTLTPTELPQGAYSPATAVAPLEIWAHDDTTKPGHVYRYKIRLVLKNPLFATQGMAKNSVDEKRLSIFTDTAFSDPVISPKKQYFFANSPGDSIANPKIKFEYFWWEDGDWKTRILTLQPGDAVGYTPWTLVDLRPVGTNGEHRAMLVMDSGEIESHFYKTDQAGPEYKRVKALIKPATATATP